MPACSKCGEMITREAVTVGERSFHRECFRCADCNGEIAGEFIIRDGQDVCLHCHEQNDMNAQPSMKACSKCGGLIQGRGVRREGERFEFHRECLLCIICQNPLSSKNEGGNVCLTCYREKLYPSWNEPTQQWMSDDL